MILYPFAFINTSLGIVTSDLILNLDAGNTASYPGTGNTWYDLSGSKSKWNPKNWF